MEDVSMKMSLLELYELIGDNQGVNFLYEDLPGIVVTIGFTRVEDENGDDNYDDDGEGSDGSNNGGSSGKARLH